MDLEGRSAIVAGGAGGLGSATARRLASRGVGVVVLDPDGERGRALAGELGSRVTAVAGDSNDDDAVTAAIDRAGGLGTPSIAVSATGVVIPSRPLVGRDGSSSPRRRSSPTSSSTSAVRSTWRGWPPPPSQPTSPTSTAGGA